MTRPVPYWPGDQIVVAVEVDHQQLDDETFVEALHAYVRDLVDDAIAAHLRRNRRAELEATATAIHDAACWVVARAHDLTPDQLRHGRDARPRQLVWWLLRRHTDLSLPQIGALADRDHSTVLHGVRQADHRIACDPALARRTETWWRHVGTYAHAAHTRSQEAAA